MSNKNKRISKGFTIVELLIVIVIIGILAALVVVAYNGIQARANSTKRMSDIRQFQKVLELYYTDNSTYPPTPAGYDMSLLAPVLTKYTKTVPTDSQYPYQYYQNGADWYGIRLYYEGVGYCRVGNMNPGGWWGVPYCPQ